MMNPQYSASRLKTAGELKIDRSPQIERTAPTLLPAMSVIPKTPHGQLLVCVAHPHGVHRCAGLVSSSVVRRSPQ